MNDYEIIKSKYSERLAKLCRQLFPTILENNGELSNFMLERFYPNPTLYQDIAMGKTESFKNYIYSFFNINNEEVITNKSVRELLDEAGYYLFECHSEEEIQSFKKYYAKDEELCTFNGGRLNSNIVFFAVKKDVESIKRSDFKKPLREDLYGTSVISIQFSRGESNILSIKNRYNHIVPNPDATFSNNLENIIPGLTYAFENEYNLNINRPVSSELNLSDYVIADDGKYYKFNYNLNDKYYCPNNIIIDNKKVIKLDGSRYKLIDYFIVDYHDKCIRLYDEELEDSFVSENLKRINVERVPNTKETMISIVNSNNERLVIEVDESSKMLGVGSQDMKYIPDNYLYEDNYLKVANFPNVKEIGDNFLQQNENIKLVVLPEVEKIGSDFLSTNTGISKLNFPNLKKIEHSFLFMNNMVDEVFMPKLEVVGGEFLYSNDTLDKLWLPNLREVGYDFMFENKSIKSFHLPSLRDVDDGAFGYNAVVYDKFMEEMINNDRRANQEEFKNMEEIIDSKQR